MAVGLGTTMLLLAFAVSSPLSGAAAKKKPKPPAVVTLNVVMPTTGADDLNFVATNNGFFKRNYLKVNISLATSTTLASEIASGQAQIGVNSIAVPLQIAEQGIPTSVIYALTGGGQGGSLMGPPGATVTSIQAAAKPGCAIGSLSEGTSAYGAALIYIQKLSLPCTVIQYSTTAAEVGALAGGSIIAIAGAYNNFVSALAANQVVAVVNTENAAQSQQYLGTPHPEVVLFGLTATLNDLRPAVVRYLKAISEAAKWLSQVTPTRAATQIQSEPVLAGITVPEEAVSVTALNDYRWKGSEKGYITSKEWGSSMNDVALWGVLNFKSGATYTKYGVSANMSYYVAALGKPKS